MDFGFDVPPSLLQDPDGAQWTDQALSFATNCGDSIKQVFSATFKRDAKSPERFKRLKERLEADYWSMLASHFRNFVHQLGERAKQPQALDSWYDTVLREARTAFDHAAEATGDDGNTLLRIEQGKAECRKRLTITYNKIKQGGSNGST
jgi:hypothetical protein